MFEHVSIGLALGAGGARGLAHIGVLKGLERAGIRISALAGSSMGALVGAAYAVAGNAASLEDKLMDLLESRIFRESGLPTISEAFQERMGPWHQRVDTWLKRAIIQARFVSRPAILDSTVYRELIDYFLPDVRIEDLKLPFWALGTDLVSGVVVVFRSGSLRDAIYASTAIPGLVRPLAIGDLEIVDGGVLNMVPVEPARVMGVDVVVAVDVEKSIEGKEDYSNAVEVLLRVEDIQNNHIKERDHRLADLVLKPDVGHIHFSDFSRATEIIRLGQDAFFDEVESVRALARRRRWPGFRRPHQTSRYWVYI